MTHPLADMPDRPPGRGPSGTAATGEPSLSMQQRTVLERLITRTGGADLAAERGSVGLRQT